MHSATVSFNSCACFPPLCILNIYSIHSHSQHCSAWENIPHFPLCCPVSTWAVFKVEVWEDVSELASEEFQMTSFYLVFLIYKYIE